MTQPNPVAHLKISLIKSIFRLIGCGIVFVTGGENGLLAMAVMFALAEVLGVVEELV
jgi:hypothetical protein